MFTKHRHNLKLGYKIYNIYVIFLIIVQYTSTSINKTLLLGRTLFIIEIKKNIFLI